jgi:cystathionine beta-lyase
VHPFDAVREADLRVRQSAKWRHYPADVLPAWVAEMDFPLAEPIRLALRRALDADDCGYAYPADIGDAFARWARAHYGWDVDPRDVRVVADVVTGIGELLRVATEPGDRVVIDPPVYAPFASTIRTLGRVVVETPLVEDAGRPSLDLDAIARAYAQGARVHLLCSPHNPAGTVHSRATLAQMAELADRHGVLVLSDEIHAPLTLPGATHHPFPSVSEAAARRSIVLTSASKAWNLAGLKAALLIACAPEPRAILARLPPETPYHAGHHGVIAAGAAFREGDPWLALAIAHLDRNRALLADLLADALPSVRYQPPQAGYLAWLDCRALGLGPDPARAFLDDGRVALSPGPSFGAGGDGFARLNFATPRALLEEAVRRMARAVPRT